jgi:hypothetical protein
MDKELLHGTLEVLILKTLSWGAVHGFGIGRWIQIQQLSGNELRIEEGSPIPPSTASRRRAGSMRPGDSRKTSAAPSSIGSRPTGGDT